MTPVKTISKEGHILKNWGLELWQIFLEGHNSIHDRDHVVEKAVFKKTVIRIPVNPVCHPESQKDYKDYKGVITTHK